MAPLSKTDLIMRAIRGELEKRRKQIDQENISQLTISIRFDKDGKTPKSVLFRIESITELN